MNENFMNFVWDWPMYEKFDFISILTDKPDRTHQNFAK